MYCKKCGQQIADNSNFCSHCGAFQKIPQSYANPQQVVSQETVQKLEGVFGLNITKPVIGFYMLWFIIHMILLLGNWNSIEYANKYFWPFSRYTNMSSTQFYDLTEFFSYVILPLLFIFTFNLFRKPKAVRVKEFETKYDHSYQRDFNPTIIGFALLILSGFTNILLNDIDKYEMKEIKLLIIFSISLIIRIMACIWLKNSANKINRDSAIWAFFGFATPTISLIVFGFMRKLKISQQQ